MDLILLVFVLGTYNDDEETNYRFKIFATLVTIGTVLNVVTAIVTGMGNLVPIGFRLFFNTFDCLMGACAGMAYYLYMVVFAGVYSYKKVLYYASYFINTVYLLFIILNLFTGIIFSYAPDGTFVHGPIFSLIYYIVPLLFVVAGVMVTFVKRKFFTSTQRGFLGIGLIAVLILFYINMNSSFDILMFYYIGSMGMFMVFLTLETPDYIRLLQILKELDKARDDEKKALEKVKASDEAKSRFLSHLSHEIKTPLNAILGYSQEIIDSATDPVISENAGKVFKGARRLNQFFSDLVNNIADAGEYDDSGLISLGHLSDGLDKKEPHRVEKSGAQNAKSFSNYAYNAGAEGTHLFGYRRDSSQYRLLCVDDNELNLELLVRTLKQFGFTVDSAVNGKEAVSMMIKNSYDAVFMDHMMPVMDGVEALHVLRRDAVCDLTPVIVVTANAVKGERDKYLKEGFDSYVPKPFTGGSLLRALGKFLPIATMDTLVRVNEKVGITRMMLASTFSRPFIAPGARILVAGEDRNEINRIARLLLCTLAQIEVVYDGDDCVTYITENDYDIVFVEDGLKDSFNRQVRTYIWNNASVPSILILKDADINPQVIYESYTDYIEFGTGPEILDAMLLLYLPKDKAGVIGSKGKDAETVKAVNPIRTASDNAAAGSIKNADLNDKKTDLTALPDYVRYNRFINAETGVENCGSEDGLMNVIDIFVSTWKAKAEEIEGLYKNRDIEGYTIRVHALKSSARIIGAMELSELAKTLEYAGKERNENLIDEKTDELLKMYSDLANSLKRPSDPLPYAGKPAADKAMIKDAYSSIYELASVMDFDSIEMIFETLDKYSFEDKDKKALNDIKNKMDQLDWNGVQKAAREAL